MATALRLYDSQTSSIRKAIGYVFILLGLGENEIPNEDAQQILVNWVKEHYANITVDDIKSAYDGALINKFLVNPKEEVNDMSLYGKVYSSEAFSKVVNAYLNWKRDQLPPPTPPAALLAEDNRTQEQKDDDMLEGHVEMTKKLNKVPEILMVNDCFRSLQRQNKIDLSEANIAHVRQIVKGELVSDAQGGDFAVDIKTMVKKQEAVSKINNDDEIRYRMKRKYLELYLKQLIV
jgi:hypothetical protein